MNPRSIEKIDGIPIAHIDGDIDAANATAIQQHLAEALDADALSLVVDLTQARYLDSAGIDMLLRLSDRLDRGRTRLTLVIPDGSPIRRLATIVGLPDAVSIHSTLESALQEAARTQAAAPPPD